MATSPISMVTSNYEQWYLKNITATARNQQSRIDSDRSRAELEKNYETETARRFDRLEIQPDDVRAEQSGIYSREDLTAREAEKSQQISEEIATPNEPETPNFKSFSDFFARSMPETEDGTRSTELLPKTGIRALIRSGEIDYSELSRAQSQAPIRDVAPMERFGETNRLNVVESENDALYSNLPIASRPTIVDATSQLEEIRGSSFAQDNRIEQREQVEIEQEAASGRQPEKITPEQQQGIEAYQRNQNYTNSYQISMVAAYSVA